MQHREYKEIQSGADTAVLLIHGIAGTPNHFRPFLPLIPQDCTVWNLLLKGHGGSVRDFSRASMEQWEDQVRQAVEELAQTHSRIFLAAHSMGTLFAIEQAIREPKIRGLFLLAVPLRLKLRLRLAGNCIKVFFGRIRPEDVTARAAKDCYGIARDYNLLHYLGWIPRYLELFGKIRRTRELLPALNTPALAFQSAGDELVSVKSAEELKKCPALSVRVLPCSGHYYYAEGDREELLAAFREFTAQ